MKFYTVIATGLVASFTMLGATAAVAAPIAISEIVNVVNGTSTSSQINDGLADAFDGYGRLSNLGGLSISRRVDTLESTFTYRFLEAFTNNTGSTISTTVGFGGNLGSDGGENIERSDAFSHITFEDFNTDDVPDQNFTPSTGCCGNDPVLAFVFGNNVFASSNISITDTDGDFDLAIDLIVDPGETVSLLFFVGLLLDQDDRAGDVTRALALADGLIAAPDMSGFSSQELSTIVNFNAAAVPEPGALALLGISLVGFGVMRRRRKA